MRFSLGLIGIAAALGLATPSAAQVRPSLADSFPLGDEGSLLCQAQSQLRDPALGTMFDRAYAIVCRDAAAAVGQVYALRDESDPASRLANLRAGRVGCETPTTADVQDLVGTRRADCTLSGSPVAYTVYEWRDGDTVYVAEGLAGYDSALRLALRSVVRDSIVPGTIEIATTQAGDPAAFAAVQAGTLNEDQALSEAYRRNNSGNYAEASEFFETLARQAYEDAGSDSAERAGEFLINQALQQSNLGNFEEAEAVYEQALTIPSASPTQLRLRRNFRVLHLMNQGRFEDALAVLDEPLETSMNIGEQASGVVITTDTAAEINSSYDLSRQLGGEDSERLTVAERAIILDAQSRQLRGTILRLQGRGGEAVAPLERAIAEVESVRDGRVRSTARLRAQALTQLALIAEDNGDFGAAEARLLAALELMQTQYPFSLAASAAKARYASFQARRGNRSEAMALFAEVVEDNSGQASPRAGLENQLAPYFELLLAGIESDPSLADQFFLASETLVRPGVANTQAVLARELSAGNDDAARLFRQSVTLTRAIESRQTELARLRAIGQPDAVVRNRIATLETELARLTADQTETQAALADFPRYRALSTGALTLADLQATLRPGEAYLKMSDIAGRIYAIFVTPDAAIPYRAEIGSDNLEFYVGLLRETIAITWDDQVLTYPFNVSLAHYLYTALLGPVADQMASAQHLIFEPDGAMLELPLNLLVTEEAGVVAYESRAGQTGDDPFDFTGIAWLGRTTDVSTAVSARSFRDLRNLAPSQASREYIGFGDNEEPAPQQYRAAYASAPGTRCAWPIGAWRKPIPADELYTARRTVGEQQSTILTGQAFTDTAVLQSDDLDDYRIVHFATHGLVTQPSPDCPPDPALLTSFGPSDESDGLLSFAEIFDLNLDADLVILSACDTASAAGISASRQAGISGGTSALDGLVRAFVGAGSRVVIASHWPAPEDYNATERLISGLFQAGQGTSIAGALRTAQRALMSDPATSHPYYWAGFAIVGDGTRTVVSGD